MNASVQGIAIPFFNEREWSEARAQMDDRDTFHDSYADYLQKVEAKEAQLRRDGLAVMRVHIRLEEFVPWCHAAGCKVDANARAQFAAWKASQADRGV